VSRIHGQFMNNCVLMRNITRLSVDPLHHQAILLREERKRSEDSLVVAFKLCQMNPIEMDLHGRWGKGKVTGSRAGAISQLCHGP
jgi:hypothetical protein